MTSFYLKTDLAVAGPFTGIEIREACLAGIIRPQTFLSESAEGPWVAAGHAGLFSETGVALPHPVGTAVPMFQTRGMPGAFMGPFKLRELIGFACQGMLPPGTELQSDPARPWIPITGTGILPSCLRGDLVRIRENGRLCLRTVVPADLDQRRRELETLPSPIDRAKQIKASGATAAPSRTKPNPLDIKWTGDSGDGDSGNDGDAVVEPPPISSPIHHPLGVGQGTGDGNLSGIDRSRRAGKAFLSGPPIVSAAMARINESLGSVLARPKLAAAVLALAMLTIGLPVAYSSWTNSPIPRQAILGEWVPIPEGDAENSRPRFGVGFHPDGTCVLANSSGASWTGDFQWAARTDQNSGFRPSEQIAVQYDTAEPGHWEEPVIASDGYLRLSGFVKEPPLLDGHPVRDLFIRRKGDQLKVGYLTESRWNEGSQELIAAWVEVNSVPASSRSIVDFLRDLPEEIPSGTDSAEDAKSICVAIDDAIKGREFEYRNQRSFRNGCFVFSKMVDAAYLLKHVGVPDLARPLRGFEKQLSYNGPSMDGAQVLRYDFVDFFVDPEGKILFLEVDLDAV